jgi:uncharacterized repeat protein (TIGR03803 family)
MSSPSIRWKGPAAAACWFFLSQPAGAGVEVLHHFQRPGTAPTAPLLVAAGGDIYGTCSSGGANGAGSVFRITAGGTTETVFSFSGADGRAPAAGLVTGPDGASYGTTSGGGAGGFGTAFRIAADGSHTRLVDFTGTSGAAKGSVPGPLVLHGDGFFYGTTAAGGSAGAGTVFRMDAAGTVTTLAEFTGTSGAARGSEPVGRLLFSGPAIYGVCRSGGSGNLGTVFRLDGGALTTLVDFTGNAGSHPGARPAGGLVEMPGGQIFGTTEFGGTAGFGTAFRLTTGANPLFTSIRSFDDLQGSQPVGEMAAADATTLLGTLAAGGGSGWGGVFRLTTAGDFTVLASFTGESGALPGAVPRAGLTATTGGTFIGTTSAGGPGNLGTVFQVDGTGAVTTTTALSPDDGWMPSGAPVPDGQGGWLFPLAAGGSAGGGTVARWDGSTLTTLAPLGGAAGSAADGSLLEKGGLYYGLASQGAASGRGSAFRIDPSAGTATPVNAFTSTGGTLADGGLIVGSDDALYGVGREGGTSGRGTLFKVTTAGVRTRIVSFTGTAGAAPGTAPWGPLVLAPSQTYYGVTARGGSQDQGVLFRLSSAGTYTPLVHFTPTGPRGPAGGLATAADGGIYGTCRSGGPADAGVVFHLDPATEAWSVAAEFDGSSLGGPVGDLRALPDGALAGLTAGPGDGGAFRYSAYEGLQVLARFEGITASADDGAGQVFTGGIAQASDGTYYGTAAGGGDFGGGVLFRIVPDPPLTVWKSRELGDPSAPDEGDADADGVPNVVEYALGTPPDIPSPAPRPVVEDGRLTIEVPRDPARNDVVHLVEVSSDLAVWQPLAASVNGGAFTGTGYLSGETAGSGVKSVRVRDPRPVAGMPQRFLRLRVFSGFTPASPIETWKLTWLGDAMASDSGDPDHDGRENLLEYALHTVPTTADAAVLPLSFLSERLALDITRDPAKTDLILTVEAAAAPDGPWSALATSTHGAPFTGSGIISGEVPGVAPRLVQIGDTVAVTESPARFLRLRASR